LSPRTKGSTRTSPLRRTRRNLSLSRPGTLPVGPNFG